MADFRQPGAPATMEAKYVFRVSDKIEQATLRNFDATFVAFPPQTLEKCPHFPQRKQFASRAGQLFRLWGDLQQK